MSTADGIVVGTTKVLDHGPVSDLWNIAVLGDGYRAAELAKYQIDVDRFVSYLYGTVPFNEVWNAINIYRVDVASTDSGAFDPVACGGKGFPVATYFDSTYCYDGVAQRLLYGSEATALAVSAAQVPSRHVTLVLVNSNTYGGGGGGVAWFSSNPKSVEIALHAWGYALRDCG